MPGTQRCPWRTSQRGRQSRVGWLWQVPIIPPSTLQLPFTSLRLPLVQSLDWETFEQYCTWQLFLAHSIPLETIIPILQHLKYKGEPPPGAGEAQRWVAEASRRGAEDVRASLAEHPEALSCLLLQLRREK